MKKIAVIILNYNGEDYLRKFLPSVIQYSNEADIIVADNGSKDDSITVLQKEFPTVKTIIFKKNHGFAGGYNKAIDQVSHEYIVLLNSDVQVTENWLNPMLSYLEKNKEVAAAQPKILSYHEQSLFEYAGAAGGYIDKYGYPYCRGRILNFREKDQNQYNSIEDIFWASGCALFIRRDVYIQEGGLDSDFFAHQEEIDLCWRLKARNYRIVCIPQSIIYHVGAGTLDYESPFKTFLNFRNNALMLYKNLPSKGKNRIMFIRYILDMMASIHLLFQGKYKNSWQVIKARIAYIKLKPHFKSKRILNQEKLVHKTINEQLSRSILTEYYLKRHKKYSDIGENN